jgi:hypothetical protein
MNKTQDDSTPQRRHTDRPAPFDPWAACWTLGILALFWLAAIATFIWTQL